MNNHGQSMIEFALIAVLVILGIVIMGPYVLRSVNAHFKLWDEGVRDSYTEKITQAPVSAIPDIPLNCTCKSSAGACGSSLAGSQCGANQRIYNHTCSLQGCDGAPASSCINDPSCCSAWAPIGCGNVPLGQPPTSTNCNYGYQILAHQCGSNNTIQCSPDPSCPLPACLGILSPGAVQCLNEPPANGTLTQNNGITYVQGSANCNPSATCQYYCAAPYIINSTGTSCLDTYIVAPCVDSTGRGCASCGGWPCRVDINDVPFTPICAASGATLTVTSQTPQPQCGDPGTPNTTCTINFTY